MSINFYKILVVDDEYEFLELMSSIILDMGYQVVTACDGIEGLEKLKKEGPFAVIISDQKMPKLAGADFLENCKKIAPDSVRIMITAFQEKEIMKEAINKGEIFYFLTKPIDISNVEKIVIKAIERFEKLQRNEAEIREKDDSIRKLWKGIQQSPASIMITNREGNIEYVNPKFTKLTGYTYEEVVGKNPRILKSGEKTPEEYKNMWSTIVAGNDWQGEFHNKKKNGEFYWEYATISPIKNEEGEITHFIAIKEDITALKNTESELIKAKEDAESATKTKSAFLAQMTHELRTPLNAILGYSALMEEEAEETGVKEFIPDLQKIQSAGKHLLGLINNILDLAKIEAGKVEIDYETVDLRKLIDKLEHVIHPLAEKNGNVFLVETQEDFGEVSTDSTKLLQILINLLGNACKFTKNGTVKLTVRTEMVEDNEWFVFEVSDTGVGMTKDQCQKVFGEFEQADSSTTRKFGGTGLGLSISKLYCEMMGGHIFVESEEGKGSSFIVKLPNWENNKTCA